MTPIEKTLEALARCTPYMYKYSPVEAYAEHCTLVDALRAQQNIQNYLEKDICTAFTDWWNRSDGSPSYQDTFKAGYEAALRAQPDPPPYPEGDVVMACVCGSWPGGKCLQCEWVPAQPDHSELVRRLREATSEDSWCELMSRAADALEGI